MSAPALTHSSRAPLQKLRPFEPQWSRRSSGTARSAASGALTPTIKCMEHTRQRLQFELCRPHLQLLAELSPASITFPGQPLSALHQRGDPGGRQQAFSGKTRGKGLGH